MEDKDRKTMKRNKGSILASSFMLFGGIVIILLFVGILLFQQITVGIFHDIKNDLYLINRNVLFSLQKDLMGEDKYDFYEKEVKELVEKEIKNLWNADVSCDTSGGIIKRVDIIDAKIINKDSELEIISSLKIHIRPIIFRSMLEDKFIFNTIERTRIKKMWG